MTRWALFVAGLVAMVLLAAAGSLAETRSFGGVGGEVHILTTSDKEVGFQPPNAIIKCRHIITAKQDYPNGSWVIHRCFKHQAGDHVDEHGRSWKHYVFQPENPQWTWIPKGGAKPPGSITGSWHGKWKNSNNNDGYCNFSFTEYSDGTVIAKGNEGFGRWKGTRRGNVITMRTEGKNKYKYTATVNVTGSNTLQIKYQGNDPTGKRAKGANWSGVVDLTMGH